MKTNWTTPSEAENVVKVVGMLRLEMTAPLWMSATLARERGRWFEDNIPDRHDQDRLFRAAQAVIEREGIYVSEMEDAKC